jgi:DeoR family fructose operon transcriptional repressor
MTPRQRQDMILKALDQHEMVEITDLSRLLNVAEMTIRRDLSLLEEQRFLERVRGGAARIKRLTTEYFFEQNKLKMNEEKIAIGKALPQYIEKNDTVFINSGTTVLQAATNLNNLVIRIISNNLALATIDLGRESTLIILGGEFQSEYHCTVGEQAIDMTNQIYANKAIIGVAGLSIKYGLTTHCFVEAGLNRKMIEHTHGKVIVVADHTKIGKVGPFNIAPIESMDILITTKGFPTEYFDELIAKGITIVVSNQEGDTV